MGPVKIIRIIKLNNGSVSGMRLKVLDYSGRWCTVNAFSSILLRISLRTSELIIHVIEQMTPLGVAYISGEGHGLYLTSAEIN